MLNETQLQAIKHYRTARGFTAGFVLFFDGKIYGWKNELRNPEAERPGAIAVDVEGNQWLAIGGNDYDGAERWLQVFNQNLEVS